MIKIKTDYPDAVHSPDFQSPIGAKQDNHSSVEYLSDLDRIAGKEEYSYLDLGCAGGQAVVDVYNKGLIACGIEGSDLEKMTNQSKNGVAENWKTYKDKCLFKADLTKPFELLDEENNIQKFDVITAWDVLEHPKPDDIPKVIENVKKHLKEDGVFIVLVNTVPFSHHQCVKPESWWISTFENGGLINVGFDSKATPRNSIPPIVRENDIGFKFKFR